MPLPLGIGTGTVHGEFLMVDGRPYTGRVTFQPSVSRLVDADDNVILVGGASVALDSSGEFTIVLPGNDEPSFNPTGWTYKVYVHLNGRDSWKPFNMSLAVGEVIEFSDVVPIASSTGDAVVRGEQGPPGEWTQITQVAYDLIAPGEPGVLYVVIG